MAMGLYALLAFAAWQTLSATVDVSGRHVPLVYLVWAILAMFALRTWVHARRDALAAAEERNAAQQNQAGPM
jgi:hypothetical protein